MLSKIDHIGIAVKDLNQILETLKDGFGLEPSFSEEVPDQNIRIAGFQFADSAVEYFEPTSPESPISRFLEKINYFVLELKELKKLLISVVFSCDLNS